MENATLKFYNFEKKIGNKKKLETVILKFFKMSQKNTGPILEILCKKFSNIEKNWNFFCMEKYPK